MDLSELQNDLDIIIEKEMHDLRNGSGVRFLKEDGNKSLLKYPDAETLLDLFLLVRDDKTLKAFFLDFLFKKVTNDEEILYGQRGGRWSLTGVSQLCFLVLIELGFIDEAIASFRKRKERSRGIYALLLSMIPEGYFNEAQLKEILSKVRSNEKLEYYPEYSEIKVKLDSLIVDHRFKILKTKTRRINIEINQDKKAVSEKIDLFGFDKSYNGLLEEIDNFIDAETSEVVNAGMISNLRTFMENLLKDVAHRIAESKGELIPKIEGHGEMGCIRSYLKTNLGFSDNDNKLIDSFVDVLHKEGGHSFTSEKEYFRLARNMAIEISLFVLSKYGKKFKS